MTQRKDVSFSGLGHTAQCDRLKPGTTHSPCISDVGAGAQEVEPSSIALLDALSKSLLGNGPAETQTTALIWDAGVLGGNLICIYPYNWFLGL